VTATTEWWWIRHAPVPGAPARIFGQLDVACDVLDRAAFTTLAARLPEDAVWIVSPLQRTAQTAAALAEAGRPLPPLAVEPDFAEQNFGRWQGLSWTEMETTDPDAYVRFWEDPTRIAPPGGESFEAVMRRAEAAILRWTEAHHGRTIVSVSHGGTIRAAVAAALSLSSEQAMAIVVDNLSVTRISHVGRNVLRGRGGAWRVVSVNAR
jgi:broad specificity phosphatase PhoE